jgi:hypothetical protein
VQEQLLRRYRNAMLQPGKAAAALRLQCLAGGPHWSSDELAAALEAVKDVQEVQVGGNVLVLVVSSSCALCGEYIHASTAAATSWWQHMSK